MCRRTLERRRFSAVTVSRLLLILIIGAGGGFLSGVAGVGGAAILIPLMVAWLGVSQHHAQGSSSWVIVFTAAGAVARYAVSTPIDFGIAGVAAGAGVIFGVLGANLAGRLDPRVLRRLFAVLLIAAATRMLISAGEPTGGASIGQTLVVAATLGAASGLVAGLLGVGGGIVLVPGSVILLGLPQIEAQALSLLVMVPTTLAAALTSWRLGNMDWRITIPIAGVAIAASVAGSTLALALPGQILQSLFAILLLFFAQQMLGVQAWGARKLGRCLLARHQD